MGQKTPSIEQGPHSAIQILLKLSQGFVLNINPLTGLVELKKSQLLIYSVDNGKTLSQVTSEIGIKFGNPSGKYKQRLSIL